MSQTNRTPGQAEGTEQDIDATLGEHSQQPAGNSGKPQQNPLEREPGTTPGQAEGTGEQAEGSLRHQQ
jgi:hypothetical protein